jgi:chorismate mutase/prephenate dehydratase
MAIENTNEGAVTRALDLLNETSLMVCGEVVLPIQHNLLTASGSMVGVLRVKGHAHALAQCHHWLSAHAPQLTREAVLSNAEAERMAHDDATTAAIASARSAVEHRIRIAHPDIQDDRGNLTRFLVLSHADAAGKPGRQKSSLIVSVPNAAGSIFRATEPFARHNVSLSKFESRPTKMGKLEYNFYIDVDGDRLSESVSAAISDLTEIASVKVLGSYPGADAV